MAKSKAGSVYVCRECGFSSAKWLGKCTGCGSWNSMYEETVILTKKEKHSSPAEIKELSQVVIRQENRIKSDIEEFDRVLGGGLVEGSLVLVGGDPGIGKSTLVLQAAKQFSAKKKVLYVSGEESETQIKMRADRLGISGEGLLFLGHTDIDEVIAVVKESGCEIVIIDSIQTMETENSNGIAGSVSQVRECCMLLMELAKKNGISVLVIGHVTKDGNIAGPKILEHMVDCVLYFEGEKLRSYRMLRAVKNRFGSTNEVGVFEMTGKGLEQVKDPSMLMLSGRKENTIGSSIFCTIEGTRPIMAEIQALVTPTGFGNPRRMVAGLDYNRSVMLMAVMEKNLRANLQNQDIYINIAGGMKIVETVSDLALVVSILSGLKNMPVSSHFAFAGEIGLTGEVRFVSHIEKRLAEFEKMGFKKCLLPGANRQNSYKGNMKLFYIDSIAELSSFGGEIFERNNS